MTTNPIIFDRNRVRLHKNRAVHTGGDDFLLQEMAVRAIERLEDLNQNFDVALEVGAHGGSLRRALGDTDKIGALVQTDICEAMLRGGGGLRVVADEEFLPVARGSVDLCISLGSMHWINDLAGSLIQMSHALKSGGLFLAILPGGQTLKELRGAFEKAEMEITGGMSPRVSPFVDAKDMGSLLGRAGFVDPVADSEILTLEYEHPLKLLKELRSMGESNALLSGRKHFTPVSVMMLMADMYMREHMNEAGRIPATIELVTLTAWKK